MWSNYLRNWSDALGYLVQVAQELVENRNFNGSERPGSRAADMGLLDSACFNAISVFRLKAIFAGVGIILPHLKIYLSGDSLPHEKNYLKRWKMMPSASGAKPDERGVEDGAKYGDEEGVE